MTQPAAQRWARQRMIMGLPFSVHLRGRFEPAAAEAAVGRVWADLEQADQLFSTYRPDSEISRLDRGELSVRQVHPMVAEILELGETAKAATGGAFDIRYAGRLDPSGIVKGWAAERACRHLRDLAIDFYLNAGGDILAHSPGRELWTLGVEHPDDAARLFAVVGLGDGALATSGSAHRGNHILIPGLRRPPAAGRQATVIGPTLTWTDTLATAAVVRGPDIYRRSTWHADHHLLIREPDGSVAASAGFADHLAPGHPAPRIDRLLRW